MADRVLPGPVDKCATISEAVCIHASKIFDSCRDKDCVEDLRVYPTANSLPYIDSACSIRPRAAEVLYVDVCVEDITFNRGYYTVDVTFFYKVTGETCPGANIVTGLAVFEKRVILYGSDGNTKVFSSGQDISCALRSSLCQPVAQVEVVQPIALNMKLCEMQNCVCGEVCLREFPEPIIALMGDDIVVTEASRRWLVTLGQFSIIRLERDTQLVIPAYNYCIPEKECIGASEEDPCTLFASIPFPLDEFFPPDNSSCDLCGADAAER